MMHSYSSRNAKYDVLGVLSENNFLDIYQRHLLRVLCACVRACECVCVNMRGSRNFFQRGSNFDEFFFFFFFFFFCFVSLVDEGREDHNTTICGPSSVRQRNTI